MVWSESNGSRLITSTSNMYEMICVECGDDGGLYADQSEAIQRIRGPYPNPERGTHAMQAHMGARLR